MLQKALILSNVGEDLTLDTRPIPIPAAGEVLVKVLISSLNPHDSYSKLFGLFVKDTLPTPLAIECIGKVEKLGPGVDKFAVGEIVAAFGDPSRPDQQYSQEYGLVTVTQANTIPKNVSLDEALTFPLNAQTTFQALFHSTGMGLSPSFIPNSGSDPLDYVSSSIAVIGGGAACGKFALEYCRLLGFGNIITIASKSNEKYLEELGATHVIDRTLSADAQEDAVRAITGDNLTMALDVVNSGTNQTLGARFLSTTKKGMLVSIIGPGGIDESQFREPKTAGYELKKVYVNPKGNAERGALFFDNIVKWVENGYLKPTTWSVIDGLDAKAVNEALDGYTSGENVVKPHLHIAEA